MARKTKKSKLANLFRLLTWVITAAAIAEQLRKPASERTWQGRVAGIVPYDFRVPTFARLKNALWNPGDDRLVVEQPFGVGWSINFGRAAKLLSAD